MSQEYLIKTHTYSRALREIYTNLQNVISEKLQCIICNASIDLHTKDHQCVLRQDKDIIIHNKYNIHR
jgi:hypothetical protein